ncbi:formyltransferase family protein [Salegentibacter salegens]|uniref:Formyl transferase n=1 Tax=Salegentibacter salegens TaxID=143223 RepID=A0A1M7NK26_9FLAO|nr:formyltransferase family protein [Salegentibacter salegens]PRX39831.1 formyl transferase-like protein [Salegentibacter salegens]SHN04063.1 Formyl transferase [Salegentibacter salegens]
MEIGLLTDHFITDFRLKTLNPILKDDNFLIRVALIDDRPKKSLLQRLKNNIKRGRGGYIFIMAFKNLFAEKEKGIKTKEFCSKNKIAIIETKKPYSIDTIEILRKYNLDLLILVGGYGIIKEPLLKITPKGVLSYHHGNMRKYRGMPPAFWELYNNENEMGVTVQILSAGLDNGIPIEEMSIDILKNDSVKKLQSRALEKSENMLYRALQKLQNNDYKSRKIEEFGKIYTLPNLRQWILLNIRLSMRR